MINVSSAFRTALNNDNRAYIERAVITLENETVLELGNAQLWGGGYEVDDAVSSDNSFSAIGSAIVNSAKLVINNIYDDYSDYVFENARAVLYIGLKLENGGQAIVESFKKGTYIVDGAQYNGSIITLSLLDYMYFFDRPYSESTLIYPATCDTIIRDACTICGINLATTTFPNRSTIIAERPTDEAINFREVIAYVSQICGCYARCNTNGDLELKWFNTDSLEDPTASVYHIDSVYNPDVSMDDVVITGVRATYNVTIDEKEKTLSYLSGSEGYVIEIEKNPMITSLTVQEIVNRLGTQLIGLRFRKANISHSSDPTLEAGDVAILDDRKGNSYPILITRTRFKVGSAQNTVCGAENSARKSATRYTAETKNYVDIRKKMNAQKDEFDRALADLAEQIADAGGMFTTQETTQSGGTITYLHNKPLLSESDIQIIISDVGVTVTSNGTDAHPTWYGLTVDGTLISNILNTVGINASWINTGQLVISTDKSDKISDYFNTTEGMTQLVNARQDDVTTTVAGVSWFTFDEKVASSIYVNSNSWIQIGGDAPSSTSYSYTNYNIAVARLDGQLTKLYRQEGSVSGVNFLKIRYEGYTRYQSSYQTDAYSIIYELFLVSDGTMILNIIHVPTASGYLGTTQIKASAGSTDISLQKVCYLLTVNSSGTWEDTRYSIPGEIFFADVDTGTLRISSTAVAPAVEETLDETLSQDLVFNKLTNNGAAEGLFLQNGQLYINMSYLQTGTLKIGGVNNTNGLLEVYNSSGTQTGLLNKDEFRLWNDYVTFQMTPSQSGTYVGTISLYATSYTKFGIKLTTCAPQSYGSTVIEVSRPKKNVAGTQTVLGDVFISERYTAYNSDTVYSRISLWHGDDYFTLGHGEKSDSSAEPSVRTGGICIGRGVFKFSPNNKTKTSAVLNLSNPFATTASSLNSGRGLYVSVTDTNEVTSPYNSSPFFGYAGSSTTYFFVDAANSRIHLHTPSCYINGNQYGWSTEHGSISYQSSSSKRYKHDITDKIDEELDAHKLYKLQMKQFVFNNEHIPQYEDMRGLTVPGFIAEDVAKIYPSAVIHNQDGEIESWDERRIIPAMLKLIQEQHEEIEKLKQVIHIS